MIRFSATRSVITEASEDFMIIHVDASGSVRLDEPDTFAAFHVRAPGQKLGAALHALGEAPGGPG